MAAEAAHVVRAGLHDLEHADAVDGAGAALHAVLVDADHEGGLVEPVHEARGHDPHDARMPAVAADHEDPVVLVLVRLTEGALEHPALDLAARVVEQLEGLGAAPALRGVGREHALDRARAPRCPCVRWR